MLLRGESPRPGARLRPFDLEQGFQAARPESQDTLWEPQEPTAPCSWETALGVRMREGVCVRRVVGFGSDSSPFLQPFLAGLRERPHLSDASQRGMRLWVHRPCGGSSKLGPRQALYFHSPVYNRESVLGLKSHSFCGKKAGCSPSGLAVS